MRNLFVIIWVLLLFPLQKSWGQSGGYFNYEDIEIRTKAAKWHDLQKEFQISAADRFDGVEFWEIAGGKVQGTHTSVDTLYVHAGTTLLLSLPDKLNADYSIQTYQRWYDIRRLSTFKTHSKVYNWNYDDLLMPERVKGYRFKNGYVGSPLTGTTVLDNMYFHYPTKADFDRMFPGNTNPNLDNKYYLVACDVSGYNDYTEKYDKQTSHHSRFQNGYWEPTLSHRVIYYICNVDDNENASYVKRWNQNISKLTSNDETTNAYFEEMEITFPTRRRANKTLDLVALTKEPRGYAIPGVNKANDPITKSLNVELKNNTAGITLANTTISGTNSIIKFNYPTGNRVANNAKASIVVYKTINGKRYNIARFKLTFKEEGNLLTQTEVKAHQQVGQPNYYRTPEYLKANFELLTEQNFDYDKNVANLVFSNPKYYPFPRNWEACSYGFYDGSYGKNSDFPHGNGDFPEWGYYALTNSYMECPGGWASRPLPDDNDPIRYNSRGNKSSFHMYIDASDRPGVVARVPFMENLCKGSELFITAWVKCARGGSDSNNAAMLFTIMGVREMDGVKTYTPIYRQQTGQIPCSYLDLGESRKNDWMQLYFSFVNHSEIDYDSYVVQIDNQSASTNGGDMYVDDIRVYMKKPQAEVTQLTMNCTEDAVRVNFSMDWTRILSRLGIDENTPGNHGVDFCFVDTVLFHKSMVELEATISDYSKRVEEALNRSAIEPETGFSKFQQLNFKTPFGENKEYQAGDDETSLALNNQEGGRYFFFRGEDVVGNRTLTVDFFSKLIPNRPYWLLITKPDTNDGVAHASDFLDDWGSPCAIRTDFMVKSLNVVRVNGEVVEPSTTYCAGKVLDFTVDLKISDGEGGYKELDGSNVYFDWFFGTSANIDTEAEFRDVNATYGVSVREALKSFRDIYPDADQISDDTPAAGDFTEAKRNLLKYYVDIKPTSGQYAGLILHKKKLTLTLVNPGLHMVIMPIKITIPGITEHMICWNYIPVMMNVTGNSPNLHIGFNSLIYPADHNPNIRIGYKQLKDISDTKRLTIDLRGATFVSEENGVMQPVDSIYAEDAKFKYIYLVGTNDPEYKPLINDEANHEFDFPIGYLDALHAETYVEGSSFEDKMMVHFDYEGNILARETSQLQKFEPKEGYEYTFTAFYEEAKKNATSGSTRLACEGQITVTMIVVPEYLVWNDTQKGTGPYTIGTWNNDDNWQRATRARLNMTANGKTYPNSEKAEYEMAGRAYTPMFFSKVVVPKGKQVELYNAGHTERLWWDNYKPDYIAPRTTGIEYELMTFENPEKTGYITERFRANLCEQIHIEPEAEVVHAEYLAYKKAWVDYEIEAGKWHLLSTPLNDVFSGDFYTKKETGRENAEYFQPIHFDEKINNRYQPSVYQRAWSQTAVMMVSPGTQLVPKTMAVQGNWSSVFNKTIDKYKPTQGFSLKVQDVKDAFQKALIRLPKEDVKYAYLTKPGSHMGSDSLERSDKAGLLISDQLYKLHSEFDPAKPDEPIKFTLENNNGTDYYLVGNPFIAHLDMKEFFKVNHQLDRKYWYIVGDKQGVALDNDGEEGGITGDGSTNFTIPPLHSFFVRINDPANKEITFTSAMQVLGKENDGRTTTRTLRITASADGKVSHAVVRYSAGAVADYQTSEDAELFLDPNLAGVPMVYTVAGSMAVSVNQTDKMYGIPLGTYGGLTDEVALTFNGTESFSNLSLYDAVNHTEIPLSEGVSVRIKGNVGGRYYLRAGAPTQNEEIETSRTLIYTLGQNRIVVSSSSVPVEKIRICRINGSLVNEIKANDFYREIHVSSPGIYVVTVQTADGKSEVGKVRLY
ncbi:MAG: hypothetical protein L6V92_09540 [Phocaeicola vulgatus]|nr:MAG: hypothetical protein L6V92_09540 [Phocaeicola vulgatus]